MFFFISRFLYSQDQTLTISFQNESLQDALSKLDEATEQQLAYNPQILPNDLVLNQRFESQTTEAILTEILGLDYQLKSIGNYVIIQKAPLPKSEKTTFQLSGGVQDITGAQLSDVSVYEINSLQSTLTNPAGEFDLLAETKLAEATFVISKKDYKDTIIRVSQLQKIEGPIVLEKEKKTKQTKPIRERVRTFSTGLAKFFTSNKVRKNAQNVNLVDTRFAQLSFIPSIGTNRKLSSQIKNKASINMIAGYAYGVRGAEIGGVYNIDREEVRGVQIGGFGNTVGGEVLGLQMGGFINTTKDYVKGAQIAGFLNVASDSVNGFQMGGFTNLTKEMRGVQIAGFNNHTRNTAGFQLSGFINTTKEMDGFQLAGFINVAKEVKGFQLSVINVADTVTSGAPFGLVNIVKKNGFISPALESDDVIPMRFSFRSGLNKFYAILSAGIKPGDYWTYGAGFGNRWFPSEKSFFINPEIRWFNIAEDKNKESENNNIVRLNFNVGYQLFKRLSVTMGPSINYYFTNHLDESNQPVIDIAGNTLLDELSGRHRHQLWIGYTFGVGF